MKREHGPEKQIRKTSTKRLYVRNRENQLMKAYAVVGRKTKTKRMIDAKGFFKGAFYQIFDFCQIFIFLQKRQLFF